MELVAFPCVDRRPVQRDIMIGSHQVVNTKDNLFWPIHQVCVERNTQTVVDFTPIHTASRETSTAPLERRTAVTC